MKFQASAMRLALTISVFTLIGLTQASCGGEKADRKIKLDLADEALRFPKPEVETLNVIPGIESLPYSVQESLDLRRAFFSGDFARLDASLLKLHNDYLAGKTSNSAASRFIAGVKDTQLAGVDACADWLSTMPSSYHAHWVCGVMWNSGAWAARGTKYINEVNPAQFALMRERLKRSNELLERALTLHPKPLQALTMLGVNHHLMGDEKQAEQYLQRAEQIKPTHLPIHEVRLNYALPEWGGSVEEVQFALERAKQSGVSEDDLLDLQDQYVVRPGKMTNPGAARAYWERAIREHATRNRLSGLLDDFVWLENWQEALPVANRLIEQYPDHESAHYKRGRINEQLGRNHEAWNDYLMAAAMGNDLALQNLIMAHLRGGLGITEKSFDTVVKLCRYGATLGSGVGANCIGSLNFEGGSAGVPFQNNPSQGLAWHLLGARAGHYNSQYDLGWLLYTGRGEGVETEVGKRIGSFWMRRAAEQGHLFAKKKLEENNISPSEEEIQSGTKEGIQAILQTLYRLIQVWL
jgi:tetratricopeptide (TPR) repeat protein